MGDFDPTPQEQASTESGESFFQRIFSLFLGGGDPEKEKKRVLKELAKSLKRSKYKFYKPSGKEALPGLAKFVYEIYKVVGPAQVFLENAESSNVLKGMFIEQYLTEEQKEILSHFTEDYIREQAQKVDAKTLTSALKNDLVNIYSVFDAERVKEIDGLYNLFGIFISVVNFDYFFFLKKFDSALPERDFQYSPSFESINADYISDDLKDFLEILILLDREGDWDQLLTLLQEYRNMEVVNRADWNKQLEKMQRLKKSGVIVQMIKHIDDNPDFSMKVKLPNERIVEDYLNRLKTQTEMTLQKLVKEKKNKKIDQLAHQVFGTTAISRMKNYTDKMNLTFAKRLLGGYTYVVPLNYLKAFLIDYLKKDIRELVNTLIVRGQWSTNVVSNQLSEAFHRLMELSEELVKFDDSLAEDGELGIKLKRFMAKSDKDKSQLNRTRLVLKEVNDSAAGMINESAQNLITMGKSLKTVLEDYKQEHHELIMNWKEVEGAYEKPVDQYISEVYKKIYYFIQLLQMYMKK
ncbi:MAG: DUF5312 domain-containing protein [Spirochaetales bacterium]|nr:DUF5312 domain-containing protein [Spirochaetales bacterium]MCF7938463.1 DUF5312 domain-containing protein [Spirochaetales bacterium]